MNKVEQHLRMTSRQLIKIDTEEEALQYLSDSFRAKLHCDFVGVIFNENDLFEIKAWSGNINEVQQAFPLEVKSCSKRLLEHSLTNSEVDLGLEKCKLFSLLINNGVETWFTVPLKDEVHHFGFCIIGFLNYVPLLKMGKYFDEFGQDVAVAIAMTRTKEMQLKKIEGIEWITKNLSIDSPFEESIEEITTRAGKGTNAEFACIYLYNDKENCFIPQSPSYGKSKRDQRTLDIKHNYILKEHFPFLEKTGGTQLTIPISMDLKTIGVIHVERKKKGSFTEEDLRILRLLSNHIAIILDNARLYNIEKENHDRLHFLLDYQQALVKETIKNEDFDGITSMLGELFDESIILYDRFMRLISVELNEEDEEEIIVKLSEKAREQKRINSSFTFQEENGKLFSVWPINGGGDLLGYLAVRLPGNKLDEYDQLSLEMARNICSIQFIKQKLVLDAKEQAMDSFISKLLVEEIENEESILQYASLFQWNLFSPHRVAHLSIRLSDEELDGFNLLEQQGIRSEVWSFIKTATEKTKDVITASFQDQYVIIGSATEKDYKKFWSNLYSVIETAASKSEVKCQVFIGIGGKTDNIQDYFISSEQARHALNIVESRLQNKGIAFFEELGSYTVLHHLDHLPDIDLFIETQLRPLEEYSKINNINLVQTLRAYLQNNGNAKATAEELYLHRSSLLYRLEKIESILVVDLNDAEVRFNLMMAFKLWDIKGLSKK